MKKLPIYLLIDKNDNLGIGVDDFTKKGNYLVAILPPDPNVKHILEDFMDLVKEQLNTKKS